MSRRIAIALLLVGAGLTACGATDAQPGGSPTPSSATSLTITLDDGENRRTLTLTCDPIGGTHFDAGAACRALDAHGETALPPVPQDRMCTQQYGGPQTAEITGTWRGQPVTASLNRKNGCEISRWNALVGLLPKV